MIPRDDNRKYARFHLRDQRSSFYKRLPVLDYDMGKPKSFTINAIQNIIVKDANTCCSDHENMMKISSYSFSYRA